MSFELQRCDIEVNEVTGSYDRHMFLCGCLLASDSGPWWLDTGGSVKVAGVRPGLQRAVESAVEQTGGSECDGENPALFSYTGPAELGLQKGSEVGVFTGDGPEGHLFVLLQQKVMSTQWPGGGQAHTHK